MKCAMASKIRGATATTAVALALVGLAAPANAVPINPDDPQCNVNPDLASCFGGPMGTPTSPSDPQCAVDAADAICKGGPFDPTTPPPIGSGLPGSLNANGTPYGSYQPPPGLGMPGMGMPGMGMDAMHPDMGGIHPGMGGMHPGMGGMHPGMGGMHAGGMGMGGPGHA